MYTAPKFMTPVSSPRFVFNILKRFLESRDIYLEMEKHRQ